MDGYQIVHYSMTKSSNEFQIVANHQANEEDADKKIEPSKEGLLAALQRLDSFAVTRLHGRTMKIFSIGSSLKTHSQDAMGLLSNLLPSV